LGNLTYSEFGGTLNLALSISGLWGSVWRRLNDVS